MKRSYFDGTIQPGQAGIARLEFQTPDTTGPVEVRFEFATNDSDQPVITFTLAANVRAVPAFVERMENPDLANGERVGGLRFWPAAHPRIYIERGETFSLWLRAWPQESSSAPVSATTEHPGVIVPVGRPAPLANATAAPPGIVTTTIRSEPQGSGYWLDIKVGPIDKAGVYTAKLTIPSERKELAEAAEALGVTLVVVDSSMSINPAAVDLGQLSIAKLGTGPVQVGTLNVKKAFGSFRILSVTSYVPALSFDVRTMVTDKNYLIRVRLDTSKGIKPGTLESPILVMTDDPGHMTLQVPFKTILVP